MSVTEVLTSNNSDPGNLSKVVFGGLLFVGIASTLLVHGGYTIWALLAAFWGWTLAVKNPVWLAINERKEHLSSFFLISTSFACFALVLLLTNLYHDNSISELEGLLPFVLYPGIFFAVLRYKPKPVLIWLACALGALGALVFASYQVFVLNIGRAEGHLMAISFGDLAVALSAVSLLGWIGLEARNQNPNVISTRITKTLLLLGFLGGALASILSGSKGGWLSLLTILIVAVSVLIRQFHGAKRWLLMILLVLTALLGVQAMPKNLFLDRIAEGVKGAVTYLQTGQVTDGSVSIRFEMWRLGLDVAADAPWLGHGINGTALRRQELVNAGQYQNVNHTLLTFENEIINRWANSGLLGVTSTLLLFVMPFMAFWRYRQHSSRNVKTIATIGWMIPVFFFEFGLSVSMFGINAFRQVYASWLILLAGLLVVELNKHGGSESFTPLQKRV